MPLENSPFGEFIRTICFFGLQPGLQIRVFVVGTCGQVCALPVLAHGRYDPAFPCNIRVKFEYPKHDIIRISIEIKY